MSLPFVLRDTIVLHSSGLVGPSWLGLCVPFCATTQRGRRAVWTRLPVRAARLFSPSVRRTRFFNSQLNVGGFCSTCPPLTPEQRQDSTTEVTQRFSSPAKVHQGRLDRCQAAPSCCQGAHWPIKTGRFSSSCWVRGFSERSFYAIPSSFLKTLSSGNVTESNAEETCPSMQNTQNKTEDGKQRADTSSAHCHCVTLCVCVCVSV